MTGNAIETRKVYAGRRTSKGAEVVVQLRQPDGSVAEEHPLRHHSRHSPTGFEWGYGGSGPADLARSLLIDALGDQAKCEVCGGENLVVYDEQTRDFRKPKDRDELRRANELSAREDGDRIVSCFECDGGVIRLPYMAFKFDVVAHLDRREWTMPAANVIEWMEAHQVTEGEGEEVTT